MCPREVEVFLRNGLRLRGYDEGISEGRSAFEKEERSSSGAVCAWSLVSTGTVCLLPSLTLQLLSVLQTLRLFYRHRPIFPALHALGTFLIGGCVAPKHRHEFTFTHALFRRNPTSIATLSLTQGCQQPLDEPAHRSFYGLQVPCFFFPDSWQDTGGGSDVSSFI